MENENENVMRDQMEDAVIKALPAPFLLSIWATMYPTATAALN